MGESYFIFGAGGQDGSLLFDELMKSNKNIVAFLGKSGLNPNFRHQELVKTSVTRGNTSLEFNQDIKEYNLLNLLMKHKPKTIFYLASSENQKNPNLRLANESDQYYVNYQLPKLLISNIIRNRMEIKFIYAGSSRMYLGHDGHVVVDEEVSFKPIDAYGRAKTKFILFLEELRKLNKYPAIETILFNHDSSRRKEGYLSWDIANQFIHRIRTKSSEPLKLQNSKIQLDWTSAQDVVDSLILASDKFHSGRLVIGSGELVCIRDIIGNLNTIFNLDLGIVDEVDTPQNPILKSNPLKANNLLGWKPRYKIVDLLSDMIKSKLQIH